jgi:hypothetical protein
MVRKRKAQIVILDKVKEMKSAGEASIVIDQELPPEITPLWRAIAQSSTIIDGSRYSY